LLGNVGHGMHKTVNLGAHDFDGEKTWVLNQRVCARVFWGCARDCNE